MRIAHVTDIHWQLAPSLWKLKTIKRALGSANLYLMGRRHHFQRVVQDALIEHLLALEPDLVLVTGDLTATALPEEFELAHGQLAPVFEQFPSFVIPGNHDVYTPGAQRERRIQAQFAPWMGLDDHGVGRLDVGDVTCIGLDPNRPTFLVASGELPVGQLDRLRQILASEDLVGRHVILCIHYPLLDRHGEVYDGNKHGLLNARQLIDVLRDAPVQPRLIVHGHEHHGFAVELDLGDTSVPIRNCGSSGYAWDPERKRAAAMNLYDFGPDGLKGTNRYLYDGERFSAEPGGAYATGR